MIDSKYTSIAFFFLAAGCYYYLTKESLIATNLNLRYDYVIVGGGTAGCVLANRLSEDPSATVLLLEAGDVETRFPSVDIPLKALETYGPDTNWGDYTTPQNDACQGMKNNRCFLARGKVIGGSSSINDMVYIRGQASCFDNWETEAGCEGWKYKDLKDYFKMAEAYQNEDLVQTGELGALGPMVITDYIHSDIGGKFLKAAKEAGYSALNLSDSRNNEGASLMYATVNNGVRWSTAKAYLRPAIARHNLHVATQSHVTKVLLYNGKAIGVEFVRNGTRKQVGAAKEVVLSAGAIGTPHVLLKSGIGPREHLEQMGIKVHADLPVGEGLFDQMTVNDAVRFTTNQSAGITFQQANKLSNRIRYNLFGRGTLASNNFLEAMALVKSNKTPGVSPMTIPADVELLAISSLLGHCAASLELIRNITNLEEEVFESLFSGLVAQDGYSIGVVDVLPKSRGVVRLRSRDPVDVPLIDPQYFEDPSDIKRLLKGIRTAQRIGAMASLRGVGSKPVIRIHPSCTEFTFNSDAYWECYIRHNARPASNFGGTCRMGAPSLNSSVVDTSLRLLGIQGIRVVDASVMPSPVSASPMAATVMIAEKAAAMMMQSQRSSSSPELHH